MKTLRNLIRNFGYKTNEQNDIHFINLILFSLFFSPAVICVSLFDLGRYNGTRVMPGGYRGIEFRANRVRRIPRKIREKFAIKRAKFFFVLTFVDYFSIGFDESRTKGKFSATIRTKKFGLIPLRQVFRIMAFWIPVKYRVSGTDCDGYSHENEYTAKNFLSFLRSSEESYKWADGPMSIYEI